MLKMIYLVILKYHLTDLELCLEVYLFVISTLKVQGGSTPGDPPPQVLWKF